MCRRMDDRIDHGQRQLLRRFQIASDRRCAKPAHLLDSHGGIWGLLGGTPAPYGERHDENSRHEVVRHSRLVCDVATRPWGDNGPES